MKAEQIQEVRELLETERILALSVLVDGEPYIGLLPYAVEPDFSAALIHASGLARHTRGLRDGAPFSILIHRPDQPDGDPLQVPRLSLQGTVQMIEKGSEEYHNGQRLYVRRFPSSEQTFSLGDFNLYRLTFQRGRFVGGFARALNVNVKELRNSMGKRLPLDRRRFSGEDGRRHHDE